MEIQTWPFGAFHALFLSLGDGFLFVGVDVAFRDYLFFGAIIVLRVIIGIEGVFVVGVVSCQVIAHLNSINDNISQYLFLRIYILR